MAADAFTGARAEQRWESSAKSTLAWEQRGRTLVAAHNAVSPIAAVRAYALLSMAQYGAVVAADGPRGGANIDDHDNRSWGDDWPGGGRAQFEARRGAIAGASAGVLSYLFPDSTTWLADAVKTDGASSNGAGGVHPQFKRGFDVGNAMADVMIAWAKTDGFGIPWTNPPYPPYVEVTPGRWRQASPIAPPAGYQFPVMRPYYMTSQNQFRPGPPPAFGSADFLAALKVVRDSSDGRTARQSEIANFWNQSNGTQTTLGYWDALAGDLIDAQHLDERAASRILALINTAAMDAVIGCWEAKYTYVMLRPSQADDKITRPTGPVGFPYNLPNHPSYPSGHSCVSAAAVTVLSAHFPSETTELQRQLAEAGMSRVFGGIHYPFDIVAGQALGKSAGELALAYDRARGLLTVVGRGQ